MAGVGLRECIKTSAEERVREEIQEDCFIYRLEYNRLMIWVVLERLQIQLIDAGMKGKEK